MPKGPNGEKRPADSIGPVVLIGKIATGEVDDERPVASEAAQMGKANSGSAGNDRAARADFGMSPSSIPRIIT